MHENCDVTGPKNRTKYVYDAQGQLAAEYATQPTPMPCTTCYLTADYLGSTRMVTDGNANVQSFADYVPFGEEIQTGVGNRSALYYPPNDLAVADGVTQKFTGRERDAETGLDYFGARYFSGAQGRWTIPDWSQKPQPVPYATLGDPQTLNLYVYVRNNPLRSFDADGHYEVYSSGCGDDAKCQKKYNKVVSRVEKARQKDLKSKDANVRAGAASFGAQGEANGVHVGLKANQGNIKGSVKSLSSTPFNPDVQVTIDSGLKGKSLEETIAHEGTHVADDLNFLNSYDLSTRSYAAGANYTGRETEFRAYQAGAGVDREHGFGPNDTQKINDFITGHYEQPYLNNKYFPDSAQFPQGQ